MTLDVYGLPLPYSLSVIPPGPPILDRYWIGRHCTNGFFQSVLRLRGQSLLGLAAWEKLNG